MQSRTLYLLLAFAVTIAAVTAAYWDDDDDDEDDALFDFEEMMEKRGRRKGQGKKKGKGRKPKWEECPEKPRCRCVLRKDGTVKIWGACAQVIQGVGI